MKKIVFFFVLLTFAAMAQVTSTRILGSPLQKEVTGTCQRFNFDKSACLECVAHYHLFEGQCYINIHGCVEYIFGNICRGCEKGFILVNNECCDKHCMGRIFKAYEQQASAQQESQEEKMQRLSIEGYEKSISTITKSVITTLDYKIISTTTQWLHGVIRYTIRIMTYGISYRCIVDYQFNEQHVNIVEFRPASELRHIRQHTVSESQFHASESSKMAFKYVTAKYGLEIYGKVLRRLSALKYKYSTQYRFIYVAEESALLLTVVVSNKDNVYLIWKQERSDVSSITEIVLKSENVEKVMKEEMFTLVVDYIRTENNLAENEIEIKQVTKPNDTSYNVTFVNEVTLQVYEEILKVENQKVQVIKTREVISEDLQSLKLPQSPPKEIISSQNIVSNEKIRNVIRYIESVQPSLVSSQISSAEIEEIGMITKYTIMENRNEELVRIVVMENQNTREMKIVDESQVTSAKSSKMIIETTEKGQQVVTTNNVDKMIHLHPNSENIIELVSQEFPTLNTSQIRTISLVEGNLSDKYSLLIGGESSESSTVQVVIVEEKQTGKAKIIDFEQIQAPTLIKPIIRELETIPTSEYSTEQISSMLHTVKQQNSLENIEIFNIKQEKTQFVHRYEVDGQIDGTSVKVMVLQDLDDGQYHIITQTQQQQNMEIVRQVSVDKVTGVKVTLTNDPSDIIHTPTKPHLNTTGITGEIQLIRRQQYDHITLQTVVLADPSHHYHEVTFKINTIDNSVTFVAEHQLTGNIIQQILEELNQQQTTYSALQYKYLVKTNLMLQKVQTALVYAEPQIQNLTPIKTTITNYKGNKVVTLVYEAEEGNQRYVVSYNPITMLTNIEEGIILGNHQAMYMSINQTQHTVHITSNDIEAVEAKDPAINTVLHYLEQSQNTTISVENIQVSLTPYTNQYTIISTDDSTGSMMQFEALFDGNHVTVINVNTSPISTVPQPIVKVPVLVSEQEPVVKDLLHSIQANISYSAVENITFVEGTIANTYHITINTNSGQKVITGVVDTQKNQTTIIDIMEVPQIIVPSTTVMQVDRFTQVESVVTNSANTINNNMYVPLLWSQLALSYPHIGDEKIKCMDEQDLGKHILLTISLPSLSVSAYIHKTSQQVKLFSTDAPMQSCTHKNTINYAALSLKYQLHNNNFFQTTLQHTLQSYPMLHGQKLVSLAVQPYSQSKHVVLVFGENNMRNRVVLYYQSNTQQYQIIEQPELIGEKQVIFYESNVNQHGKQSIHTNSISLLGQQDKYAVVCLSQVEKLLGQIQQDILKVVMKNQSNAQVYSFEIMNEEYKTTQYIQATVNKTTSHVTITDFEQLGEVSVEVEKEEREVVEDEQVQQILEAIKAAAVGIDIGINVDIKVEGVRVTATENSLVPTFTVQASTAEGVETIVLAVPAQGAPQIIDYQPAVLPTSPQVLQPSWTELQVDPLTGFTITTTNDVVKIMQDEGIKQIISQLNLEGQTISISKKQTDSILQVVITSKTGSDTKINVVFLDKVNKEVKLIAQTKTSEDATLTIVEEIPTMLPSEMISGEVLDKASKQDPHLQKVLTEILTLHPELFSTSPQKVLVETIGDTVLYTMAYPDEETVVQLALEVQTEAVTEVYSSPISSHILPAVLHKQITSNGTVILTSNSVQLVPELQPIVSDSISEIMNTLPHIETTNLKTIESVRQQTSAKLILVLEDANARLTQVTLVQENKNKKPIIVDLQELPNMEVLPELVPLPFNQLDLSITNTPQFQLIMFQLQTSGLFAQIANIESVQQAQTHFIDRYNISFVTIDQRNYYVLVDLSEGNINIIDHVQITQGQKQTVTITQTDQNTGIMSTISNDLKVIREQRTFQRVQQFIESKYSTVSEGYALHSEVKKYYQKNIQHTVRYEKGGHIKQYRLLVDSRIGDVSEMQTSEMSVDELEMLSVGGKVVQIDQPQFDLSLQRYPVVNSSIHELVSVDYTFQGLVPHHTYLHQYEKFMEVVFVFNVEIKGQMRKQRAIVLSDRTTLTITNTRIIDITILEAEILPMETKTITNSNGRQITMTNDVSSLQKSELFQSISLTVKNAYPSVESMQMEKCIVQEKVSATQYTLVYQSNDQAVQVIVDHHTQSSANQVIHYYVEDISNVLVPTREIQLVEGVLEEESPIVQRVRHFVMSQLLLNNKMEVVAVHVSQNLRVTVYHLQFTYKTNNINKVDVGIDAQGQMTIIHNELSPQLIPQPSFTHILTDGLTGTKITQSNDTIQIQNKVEKIMEKLEQKGITINSTVFLEQKQSVDVVESILGIQINEKKEIVMVVEKGEEIDIVLRSPLEEQQSIETLLIPTIISGAIYQQVVGKDIVLDRIHNQLLLDHPTLVGIIPTTTTVQQIGNHTVATLSFSHQSLSIQYRQQNNQVREVFTTTIPTNIQPLSVQTNITHNGLTTITANNPNILTTMDPSFTHILQYVTSTLEASPENIQTIISQQTLFGGIYDIVLQEENTFTQIELMYDDQTQHITSNKIQTVQIVREDIQHHAEQILPVTHQMIPVLQQFVINNVGQVRQIVSTTEKASALTTKYQIKVTKETGESIITISKNNTNDQLSMIDEQTITEWRKRGENYRTSISTDTTLNMIETTTNDTQLIHNNPYTHQILKQLPSWYQQYTPVQSTQKQYQTMVEQTLTLHIDGEEQTITAIINKNSNTTTIINQTTPLMQQMLITSTIYDNMLDKNKNFQQLMNHVNNYVSSEMSKPYLVSIKTREEISVATVVYHMQGSVYQLAVQYNESNDAMKVLEEIKRIGIVNQVLVNKDVNENGQSIMQSTSIVEMEKVDSSFLPFLHLLANEVPLDMDQITKIISQTISEGNQYTILYQQGDRVSQIVALYQHSLHQVTLLDFEQLGEVSVEVEKEEREVVEDEQVQQILEAIKAAAVGIDVGINVDIKVEGVRVTATENSLVPTFTVQANTAEGVETIVLAVPAEGVPQIIDYQPAVLPTSPPALQPSWTELQVDPLTGFTITTTNDSTLVESDNSVQLILSELGLEGQAISVIKKEALSTVQATITLQSSWEKKNIVAVLDKSSKKVKLVAEAQVSTFEHNIYPNIPSSVISGHALEKVLDQDVKMQIVTEKVSLLHPQLVSLPQKVLVETIGDTVLYTMAYPDEETVVQLALEVSTEAVTEVYSSPISSHILPAVLHKQVTSNGTVILTSNNVETIYSHNTEAKLAISSISSQLGLNTENIETIQIQGNEYNIIIEQQNSQKQINFIFDKTTSQALLVSLQTIETPEIIFKPHEPVYQNISLEDNPTLNTIISTLNMTNDITKGKIQQIVAAKKSLLQFSHQYVLEVTTQQNQNAQIQLQIDMQTNQAIIEDFIILTPLVQLSQPVIIEEVIDSQTKVREIIYQSAETFELDEFYQNVENFLSSDLENYDIKSVVKKKYGSNEQYTILLKNEGNSPQQISINVNEFNHEITLLENRTLVSEVIQESIILDKERPTPQELTLTTVEQQNIKLLGQLGTIKDAFEYLEVQNIKELQKDNLFVQAIEKVKSQYNILLQDAIVVKVLKKETLDNVVMRIFFSSKDNLYESDIQINPISHTFELFQFSKVGISAEKSEINLSSDLAYGYIEVEDPSKDQDIEFLLTYLKNNHPQLERATLQSVDKLELLNNKVNYRLFLKNGMQQFKFIVFFQQKFQRIIQIRSFTFQIAGSYTAISKQQLIHDPYFRKIDKYIKEQHSFVADGSIIVSVEWKDLGEQLSYRSIYSVSGKTYHLSAQINKETQEILEDYWNEIIEIPMVRNEAKLEASEKAIKLNVNDLNSNIYFAAIHQSIMSQGESILKNAQIIGATQVNKLFSYEFIEYYMLGDDYYQIAAEYDLSSQKIIVPNPPQRVNLYDNFIPIKNSEEASRIFQWLQRTNYDFKASVIEQFGRKHALFGTIWKVVAKLPTHSITVYAYEEGNEIRILKEDSSSSPMVRQFPRPGGGPIVASLNDQ